MSGLYKTINGVLVCCAVLATLWMAETFKGSTKQADPVIPDAHTALQDGDNTLTGNSVEKQGTQSEAGRPRLVDEEQSKVLWENNLFTPTRREGVDIESDQPVEVRQGAKMELIGIGSVDGKSAAVIIIHGGRTPRGQPGDIKRVRHLYTPGDMIEDTGYILDKVSLHEAVLTKGTDERILRFETADSASQKRSDEASREAPKTIPSPPPQPTPVAAAKDRQPTPISPANTRVDSKEIERRERLKKALEARKKILELRRGNSQKTGDVQ